MAPPKPSQRGKFRPKKPQKKTSKPPAAAATTGIAASSSLSSPSATSANPGAGSILRRNYSTDDARGGRGRGRGGRGRGGRGGRGRIPIPQGTVFFTGGEKKAASSAKGSSTKRTSISAGASRTSRKRDDGAGKNDISTEEVVGQLDTAIGGSGNTKKESILERDYGDYVDEEGPLDNGVDSINMNVSAGCMYDSDSSDERSTRKLKNMSLIAPLELPFSTKSLSTGVKPDVTISNPIDEQNSDDYHEPLQPPSPFVAMNKTGGTCDENNSWFLVQLPTRLPPMQKQNACLENDNNVPKEADLADKNVSMDSASSSSATNTMMNNLSEVAVPPVTTSCFDHGLGTNAPGRIGKICVYKSGKTVLVMDGPDDKVSMNVNEGLTCTFHQQAIAVNYKEGHYITLGDVDKSIVISPDLTSI